VEQRTGILALLPALAFGVGLAGSGPSPTENSANFLLVIEAVGAIALIVAWFTLDARSRGYRQTWALRLAMVALTALALPYYLLRSRGARGGVKALAGAILVFVASMLCLGLAGHIAGGA